jgi:hypothetical protein
MGYHTTRIAKKISPQHGENKSLILQKFTVQAFGSGTSALNPQRRPTPMEAGCDGYCCNCGGGGCTRLRAAA